MNSYRARLFAVSSAAAVALLSGCSSDDQAAEPSTSESTPTTSAVAPATTGAVAPATTAAPATTGQAPAGAAPTTAGSSSSGGSGGAGPSQTVSGGNSVAPPSVQRSASAPTGDNLPGENGGAAGRPGTPGDDD